MPGLPPTRRLAGEAVLVAAVVGFHVVDHRRVPEAWHALTHTGAAAGALVAGRLLGLSRAELGLSPSAVGRGLRDGLVSGAVSAAGVAVAASVPATQGAFDDPRALEGSGAALARRTLVDIPLGTSVYEEAVFRGTLLGLARRDVGPGAGDAIVAGLFGLWHVLPALEDRNHNPVAQRLPLLASVAPTVLATTVAGALLGRLRVRSGSLAAPIVSHAVTNVAGLLAARWVARRRATARVGDVEVP
ncbi:MAG: CPBP family intramembrane glutamic endopeptidase [Acidimicrobiales bacterium]